jgi:hypothetical protein
MVPYILVIYIFDCKSDEMHTDFFMYSLLHYACSTCFGCYLYPSSGAQTAQNSRRYAWLVWCIGCWIFHWSRLWLGHPHTYSTINLTCATYSINWLVFITEIKSVYCAVRTGSLRSALRLWRVNVTDLIKEEASGRRMKVTHEFSLNTEKSYQAAL